MGLSFEVKADAGALLVLRKPGHKMYLDCKVIIVQYMRKHLASWSAFANERLGIGLEEEDFIFVSGHMKTPVWAEAAFNSHSATGELVISGGVASASGGFQVKMERAVNASVSSRTGPLERASVWKDDSAIPEIFDQCIFLNYYKMKTRRWRAPKVIRAAAGSPHLPEYPDDESEGAAFGRSRSYSAGTSEADSDLYDTVCAPLICLENASSLCCPFRPLVPSTIF